LEEEGEGGLEWNWKRTGLVNHHNKEKERSWKHANFSYKIMKIAGTGTEIPFGSRVRMLCAPKKYISNFQKISTELGGI
jgi:hypothetical protein